jgi:hypothetical protein
MRKIFPVWDGGNYQPVMMSLSLPLPQKNRATMEPQGPKFILWAKIAPLPGFFR